MRFLGDGPSIPDDLLEERDKGNVVFFCGAGISRAAGLPDFLGLANQVVAKLGAPFDGKARTLLDRATQDPDFAPPLDQVFNILQQDYGAGLVDATVSDLLKTSTNANIEHHSIVMRLSKGANGYPQIVTTNFDLLFEKVGKRPKLHVWPALPDLASGQPFEGIVYLHGRRSAARTNGTDRQGLILSSADFGRAYLAEGWATTFVRELLQSYVIVLLGYSANDPPIRYLLEGLHSLGADRSARIYAFDRGPVDEVSERWRDRGVRPLAYSEFDEKHISLWDTLRAWASRADDPDAWRRQIIEMAKASPQDLQAHQRGQVVSVIRTVSGAKLFADAQPTRPGEWLCVFDRSIRFGKPRKGFGEDAEFDPLLYYGLDDDPPRQPQEGDRAEPIGEDLISLSSNDEVANDRKRLAGVPIRWSDPLPPRLLQLSRWLCGNLHDPAVAWWVAGYKDLHPSLVDQIEWQLERSQEKYGNQTYKVWRLLLEVLRHAPTGEDMWYRFTPTLKREGWTARTQRELERVIRPYIGVGRPWLKKPAPPRGPWSELQLEDIAHFEVKFPAHELGKLDIPSENLTAAFRVVRRSLELGAELLAEIDVRYWHTATLHPDVGPGDHHLRDPDKYLNAFVKLFDRLAVDNRELARTEVRLWPEGDDYFFDKLKIYAWMKTDLFSADEAVSGLLSLSDRGFWNEYNRRELLHTLRSQWNGISKDKQDLIEARIISGPAQWPTESDHDFQRRRAISAAKTLGWLAKQNCRLSTRAIDALPELRKSDSNWRPSWDEAADHSFDTRGGAVRVETDPSKLLDVPLHKLAELAERYSTHSHTDFVEFRPFQGLVQQRPFRALAALSYEARRGRFASGLWQAVVSCWPEGARPRLSWWCAKKIARLPVETFSQLSHYIPDWCNKHLPTLARTSLDEALCIWDSIVQKTFLAGENAVKSSVGEVSIGGEPQARSRRTYMHAINSPIGRMAETLFAILDEMQLASNAGLPEEFRLRIERLFAAPGEGADHATSVASLRLRWLFYVDPEWTLARILPLFDPTHVQAEPAWNGYIHDLNVPGPQLFAKLKPYFLEVFKSASHWRWDDKPYDKLAEFLVVACLWNLKDERYINFDEARIALRALDDQGRGHAVWFLSKVISEQRCWKSFGRAFIEKAWPREKKCQTIAVSRSFALLAKNAGKHFPEVVRTITPLLIPVDHVDTITYGMNESSDGSNLASKYPESVLALLDRLVPSDSQRTPYNLAAILDLMAESLPELRQDERWRRLDRLINRV